MFTAAGSKWRWLKLELELLKLEDRAADFAGSRKVVRLCDEKKGGETITSIFWSNKWSKKYLFDQCGSTPEISFSRPFLSSPRVGFTMKIQRCFCESIIGR